MITAVVAAVGASFADDTVATAPSRSAPATATATPAPVVTAAPPPATAPVIDSKTEPEKPASRNRDWHVGANLRTDFGARFYRLDFGLRFGRLDTILVVDPFGLENGDYDYDGIVRFAFNRHWSAFSGMRLTVVPIGRDHQYSEKALVGISGIMPSFGLPRTRLHAGVELAVHVASHGGGLMTQWVCIDSPTCRKDHFVFGFFGRLEYVSPF